MDAVVHTTTTWSRVYFITYYCTASVMVRPRAPLRAYLLACTSTTPLTTPPSPYWFPCAQVLNLVIAFILEAFFEKEMENEAQQSSTGTTDTPHQLTRGAVSDQLDGNVGGSQEFSLNSNPHFVTLEETL